MLSASKLCQSVSTSGPSATWKPSPMNTSSSRSQAWVTRWAWPRVRRAGVLGEVEPLGRDPRRERRRRRARRGGPTSAASTACDGLVERLAGRLLLVDRGERAELGLELGERALLAEQLGVERGDRVERVGGVDLGERRVTGGADVVDHGSPFGGVRERRRSAFPGWTQVRRGRGRAASPSPGVHPGHRNRSAVVTAHSATAGSRPGQPRSQPIRVHARHVGAGGPPRSTSTRRGHRDVEALGPTVVLDAHPLRRPARRRAARGPRCRATSATPPRPVGVGVAVALVRRGADQSAARRRAHVVERGRRRHGHVEQRPGAGPHDLGVEQVDRAGREHDGVDAGRLGRAQDRAEVARVVEPVGDDDERGTP